MENLTLTTIWSSKFKISPKGSPLTCAIRNRWSNFKVRLSLSTNIKKTIGSHGWNSIWWPKQPIEEHKEAKYLKVHRIFFKSWFELWDQVDEGWKSRADLVANFNLSNNQLNITTKKIGIWNRGDLWLLTFHQYPNIEVFVWKNQ